MKTVRIKATEEYDIAKDRKVMRLSATTDAEMVYVCFLNDTDVDVEGIAALFEELAQRIREIKPSIP